MDTTRRLLIQLATSAALALGLAACGGGGGGSGGGDSGATQSEPSVAAIRLSNLDYAQVMGRTSSDASLRLTPGRPTLVRAFVASTRSGVANPGVSLTVTRGGLVLGTLAMAGPPTLPTQGEVDTLGSTYNATVPAAWVLPGVSFRASLNAAAPPVELSATPAVAEPTHLHVVVVPLSVNGAVGTVPNLAEIHAVLARAFPVAAADIVVTQRAPLVIDGLSSLQNTADLVVALGQLEAVRLLEGSTAFYYGMFSASSAATALGGVGSLGALGSEAQSAASAVGFDATYQFQIIDPLGLRLPAWARILIHELGHNHALKHAPCGGAIDIDQAYPYPGGLLSALMPVYDSPDDGWSVGRLGATRSAAGSMADVMGYCDGIFFSDYSYNKLQTYAEARAKALPSMATALSAMAPPLDGKGYLMLSGSISPLGVTLNPARATSVAPRGDATASALHRVRLTMRGGPTLDYAVTANEVADADDGVLFFSSLIVNPGAVESIELLRAGRALPMMADARMVALAAPRAGAATATVTAIETAGQLHLVWDASLEPFVTVTHVGADAVRTVLALKLEGGDAVVPTGGLPVKGRFEISYSSRASARLALIAR